MPENDVQKRDEESQARIWGMLCHLTAIREQTYLSLSYSVPIPEIISISIDKKRARMNLTLL